MYWKGPLWLDTHDLMMQELKPRQEESITDKFALSKIYSICTLCTRNPDYNDRTVVGHVSGFLSFNDAHYKCKGFR